MGNVKLGNEEAVNDIDKANLFAKFFSPIYVKHTEDDEQNDFINNRNDQGHFKIHITTPDVQATLESMDL